MTNHREFNSTVKTGFTAPWRTENSVVHNIEWGIFIYLFLATIYM